MAEPDVVEGLRAFIEKREPNWETTREKKGALA
jgi:1,4-dihydroxy-2-naphthoyl-CoA synthase